MKTKLYRNLFLIAALFNIITGFICWGAVCFKESLFFDTFGLSFTESLFSYHFMFGVIVIFGYGYWIVRNNLDKNKGIVILGILGKLLFLFIGLYTFLVNEANFFLLVPAFIDLIFVGYFVEFLIKYNPQKNQN